MEKLNRTWNEAGDDDKLLIASITAGISEQCDLLLERQRIVARGQPKPGTLPLRLASLLSSQLASGVPTAQVAAMEAAAGLFHVLKTNNWRDRVKLPTHGSRGSTRRSSAAAQGPTSAPAVNPPTTPQEMADWGSAEETILQHFPRLTPMASVPSPTSTQPVSIRSSPSSRGLRLMWETMQKSSSPSALLLAPVCSRIGSFSAETEDELWPLLFQELLSASDLPDDTIAALSSFFNGSLRNAAQGHSTESRRLMRLLLGSLLQLHGSVVVQAPKARENRFHVRQLTARLRLSLSEIAEAAEAQELHAAAAQFAQLAFRSARESLRRADPRSELQFYAHPGFGVSLGMVAAAPESRSIRRVLERSLVALRDLDGLRGLGEASLVEPEVQRFVWESESRWGLLAMRAPPTELPKFLRRLGIDLPPQKGSLSRSPEEWESLWRLGRWSDALSSQRPSSFQASIFKALHSVARGLPSQASDQLSHLLRREKLETDEKETEMRSKTERMRCLCSLQRLLSLEEPIFTAPPESLMTQAADHVPLLSAPTPPRITLRVESKAEEIAVCLARLTAITSGHSDADALPLLHRTARLVSEEARQLRFQGLPQQSTRLLERWEVILAEQKVENGGEVALFRMQHRLEMGKSRWALGEEAAAVHSLGLLAVELEGRLSSAQDSLTQSMSMVTGATTQAGQTPLSEAEEWAALTAATQLKLAELKGSEGSSETRINGALAALRGSGPGLAKLAAAAHLALSRLADAELQRLEARLADPETERRKLRLENARASADVVAASANRNRQEVQTFLKARSTEAAELEAMETQRMESLKTAVAHYAQVLRCSDQQDWVLFRLLHLWTQHRHDDALSILVRDAVIPEHKWLQTWNQLVGELKSAADASALSPVFVDTFNSLMEQVMSLHPYHTVPAVYAAQEREKQKDVSPRRRGKKGRSQLFTASELLRRMEQSAAAGPVRRLVRVCRAYSGLVRLSAKPGFSTDVFRSSGVAEEVEIAQIPSLTDPPAVERDGSYPEFLVAGGLRFERLMPSKTRPVLLSVGLSDGSRARQLVKGKDDDLRQDALMSQIFQAANDLVRRNSGKRSQPFRSLMRTYNVVPLAQIGGLIQVLDGVAAIQTWLVGDGKAIVGAHERYRPSDLTHRQIKEDIAAHRRPEVQLGLQPSPDHMRRYFEKTGPVMGLWWMERWSEPVEWMAALRVYAHSLALSSVLGYVVGLGDRHTSNVMLDEASGEIVHIDFGVCFDSGRALRIPELVPFRLTRDLVDPLGPAGVNGAFRRAAESLLALLRSERAAILPILAAVTADPLSVWSHKAILINSSAQSGQQQLERIDREAVQFLANNALHRAKAKLQGNVGTQHLSVQQQLQTLIADATSLHNLSSIFHGWAPWL